MIMRHRGKIKRILIRFIKFIKIIFIFFILKFNGLVYKIILY